MNIEGRPKSTTESTRYVVSPRAAPSSTSISVYSAKNAPGIISIEIRLKHPKLMKLRMYKIVFIKPIMIFKIPT
jgi:hypothetical protein